MLSVMISYSNPIADQLILTELCQMIYHARSSILILLHLKNKPRNILTIEFTWFIRANEH